MKIFCKATLKNAVVIACSTLLMLACEHTIPLDAPAGSGGGDEQSPTVSALQSTIFNRKCALSGCHIGSSPGGGLNLSASRAFGQLVNANSSYGVPRVTPNDADNSVLYQKVIGNSRFGSRMPLGSSLSSTEVNLILDWINEGAPNN